MNPKIAQLAELKKQHPDWGRRKLARELGVPEPTVQQWILKLPSLLGEPAQEVNFEQTDSAGYLHSKSAKIKTLDDLLAYAAVDKNAWEVERYTINKYESASKDNDGNITVTPLFQIKAWLRKLKGVATTRGILGDLLASFKVKGSEGARRNPSKSKTDGERLLELSIFDLHFGKLAWAQEAGQDYDVRIAESVYGQAVDSLLARTKSLDISRILLPVGNDFFNVDNAAGTTAAGTPQNEDGRWQRSFILGRKMMVKAIERMREICPVDVVMVSGNHDTERLFYLGDVLEAWFNSAEDVSIDNSPLMRKYYNFGSNLIGLTHGNNEKHKNLPLIMATEVPELWAATKYREFHIGHWHHKSELHFQPVSEHNGIRVRVIPSLCPPDAWHKSKGYEGLRAAEAYVWDKNQGCIAQYSFNP